MRAIQDWESLLPTLVPMRVARQRHSCYTDVMKSYVHARLAPDERARLDELKRITGESETALVKKGLRLVHEHEVRARQSVLDLAGTLVGKYRGGPVDLSTNKKHLDDFGQ